MPAWSCWLSREARMPEQARVQNGLEPTSDEARVLLGHN